jgi:hypothetical protein
MLDGTFLRAQARRCADLSRQCFDLTVAGELRLLSENFTAKAHDLERASAPRFKRPKWLNAARLIEQMRALPDRFAR